jgi:hypothetical protein
MNSLSAVLLNKPVEIATSMSNDQTTKQRFHSSIGQSVTEDYLFFACLQVEKLLKAKNEGVIKPNWPELSHFDAASGSALEDSITDMLSWYAANYPILKTHLPIDYSRVAEFSETLVPLVNDLCVAFANHSMNLAEEWPKTDASDPAELLRKDLDRMFPDTADKIIRYLDWTLSPEKDEEFQIGDRPPVGRFAPSLRRSSASGGRGGGGSNRGNDRQGRGSNQGQRGDRNQRRGSGGGGDRGRGNHRGDRGPRGGDRKQVDPAIVEGRLRSEVEAAIQQMNSQGLTEISLRPQNSFNRRLQHNFVSEYSGLTSTSRGDEPERFVVIVAAKH